MDRQSQHRKPRQVGPGGKNVELGDMAQDNYKARLTKGLLGVGLGEGYIVEVVNFRSKRVIRRELLDEQEDARDELNIIREDIKDLTTDEFRKKYLQPVD